MPELDENGWGTAAETGSSAWGDAWPTSFVNNLDSGWAGGQDTGDFGSGLGLIGGSSMNGMKVEIDGRSEEEEKGWWDPAVRAKHARPGPGVLPPLLEQRLHNSEHTLYSVSVSPPDIRPDHEPPAGFALPSADEVHTAVPHPHAYYCRRHNGWVLLLWRSSSVAPPLAKSFQETMQEKGIVLPDQNRRKRTTTCVGEGENPLGGPSNKTHHFHHYPRAVDALHLNPPFQRREWEQLQKRKQARRRVTILGNLDEQMVMSDPAASDKMDEDASQAEAEGDLLDLYMCCQCSFYCVVSPEVIPGVISSKYIEDFIRDKREHPAPNMNPDMSVIGGLETIITVIENKLWKANDRALPVMRPAFQRKLGWNSTVGAIFSSLSFELNRQEETIRPPNTNPSTPEGLSNRSKLLRAWVELSALSVDYIKRFANNLKDYESRPNWVKIENTREMYQTAIGAHIQQIPRGLLPDALLQYSAISKDWEALGMTPTSYSWELLVFAYLAQCRCDPAHTADYFTHLCNIVFAFQTLGVTCPQELQNFVIQERSRSRFTHDELQQAITTLGFGQENRLRMDFDEETDDEFVKMAWRDALKEAWKHPESSAKRKEVQDALMILAQARGSADLMAAYNSEQGNGMTPERAYTTLEVPADVDEEMLITVFVMRVEERPAQVETMRDALSVIAEVRESTRLKQFLETGKDPGVIVPSVSPDTPRGLNQLGNTCYLNSLLQYFYTIKDLREAVLSTGAGDMKLLEDDKLTEDDLKRHRVGGRLVTKREIIRSKKFVHRLAELFWELEYSETAAVTPSIELAKLALVTSKDEEEDNGDSVQTDSSNDTDATLVEDAPPRHTPERLSSPASRGSPSSVLGKRPRNESAPDQMETDSPTRTPDVIKDDYVMVKSPRTVGSGSGMPEAGPSSAPADNDGDVEMTDARQTEEKKQPPPLPPRKATTKVADSGMMFGRQHDVSECMDNCMFQIETALLKFDELSGSGDDKTSVVKRLFYGKIRQRLTAPEDDRRPKASVHEKEDLFSHLPVNVSEEGYDIYDGLSGYFDDVVEFEGKKARMEVTLVDLPPLLQIQLQRVQFNRETLQPYKSQAYVRFGETVYMDRFLDSADPQKKARSKAIQTELNVCRDQIYRLTQGKHAPYGPRLSDSHDLLTEHQKYLPDGDSSFLSKMKEDESQLQAKIDTLRARAVELKKELEAVWANDKEAAYELTSVFIHRGTSPSWGHYFFYSRHLPEKPDEWFKYNDSSVSAVPKDEVLRDTTGDTANPYLLVFMRKGAEVVHTVKRFDPANLIEDTP